VVYTSISSSWVWRGHRALLIDVLRCGGEQLDKTYTHTHNIILTYQHAHTYTHSKTEKFVMKCHKNKHINFTTTTAHVS
jgi:hypothetical protein